MRRIRFLRIKSSEKDFEYLYCRPTQSVLYVPLQVNRFAETILLIVQYIYLKSFPEIFILQNLILRTRSCITGFITQSGWVFHLHLTESVRRKWFVLAVYQFRNSISAGQALKYFYMIYRGGRYWVCQIRWPHNFLDFSQPFSGRSFSYVFKVEMSS